MEGDWPSGGREPGNGTEPGGKWREENKVTLRAMRDMAFLVLRQKKARDGQEKLTSEQLLFSFMPSVNRQLYSFPCRFGCLEARVSTSEPTSLREQDLTA